MDTKNIIMNYSVPPSADDIEVMVKAILESLPEELDDCNENLALVVDELPDEAIEQELELDTPFDLLALFKSGSEISPGVEKKSANDDDVLIIFRRSVLDMWCESGEDINSVLRQIIVEELGRNFDFSDEEIEEMNERHYQGMF